MARACYHDCENCKYPYCVVEEMEWEKKQQAKQKRGKKCD